MVHMGQYDAKLTDFNMMFAANMGSIDPEIGTFKVSFL
jgi:hypothetical protein